MGLYVRKAKPVEAERVADKLVDDWPDWARAGFRTGDAVPTWVVKDDRLGVVSFLYGDGFLDDYICVGDA